ncbi:energy-coupling factor ABC transporter ATP-binding protein [Halarcobacter sp.]|uniref:energy-coupling factor ABC transporter ATP-binding protein n=1 Tax=Halarcobacter sp. TaxID=2321133 RepID=UPI0029F50A43|nr:energy-coupling factor ABC transporter ATP-binding protein [Halarcobacter sp.]
MSILYELNNVQQYYDGRKVLSIDKLILEDNQIIGFFGPNGSGKSTLFSLLSFMQKQSNGQILFNGLDEKNISHDIRQSIVMVPQNPYLLKRTVFDNIVYGLKIRNEQNNLEDKVNEALALVGLDKSFLKRKWSQLSGGEAQRVALAARLILKPKVLILDEPTTGVDTNSAQLIKEAILGAKQKWNTTILISSHDHNWLNHICDKKIALFQGHLIDSGSVNLLFAPWDKNDEGNLVKYFTDGQKLEILNSKSKKRDSVAMIDSDNIDICRVNCEDMVNNTSLKAIVTSIQQQNSKEHLLVQLNISDISFNCRVTRELMQEQRFLPGDDIFVNIDTENIKWI